MNVELEEIRSSILALPKAERAALAHDLLDSLVEDDSERIDPELREEIEFRLREYEEGRVKPMDAFEALDRIEAEYAQNRKTAGGRP
jgi:putative addiction module component (TIGR02574 family)